MVDLVCFASETSSNFVQKVPTLIVQTAVTCIKLPFVFSERKVQQQCFEIFS